MSNCSVTLHTTMRLLYTQASVTKVMPLNTSALQDSKTVVPSCLVSRSVKCRAILSHLADAIVFCIRRRFDIIQQESSYYLLQIIYAIFHRLQTSSHERTEATVSKKVL